MSIRPKVPKSKHRDGNYDNGFIHHIMKAFCDNPLSPLIGIFQASNEDISSNACGTHRLSAICGAQYISSMLTLSSVFFFTTPVNPSTLWKVDTYDQCETLIPLQWRHNGRDGVSNHQPHDCISTVYSGADQIKHQSSASLTFVRGSHRSPVTRTNGE